ncbi:hypothetical protein K523DRAFT_123062 [Schizophyllum commune Tattone D]|nr:hypothetical protein K523DRAFT_123062 [Schizophyllum commune Tattone D]
MFLDLRWRLRIRCRTRRAGGLLYIWALIITCSLAIYKVILPLTSPHAVGTHKSAGPWF